MPLHPPDRRRPDGEEAGESGDRELGVDPATGHTIWLKIGRFGPLRGRIRAARSPSAPACPRAGRRPPMDLDKALRLLRLPREVGIHPDDGKMIWPASAAMAPTSSTTGTYANLRDRRRGVRGRPEPRRAVLAEKRAGGARGRAAAGALKELGAHPADGEPVRILSGRFGPYIKHGGTNANVPKGADPQGMTLEEAVKVLAEREAKGGGGKGRRGKPAARKPTAAKAKAPKTAAKKAPAKKPAAKAFKKRRAADRIGVRRQQKRRGRVWPSAGSIADREIDGRIGQIVQRDAGPYIDDDIGILDLEPDQARHQPAAGQRRQG
jgi:DNA topoisomerase-1